MKVLILALFSLTLISCGQEANPFSSQVEIQEAQVDSAVTELYQYELTEVDCTTGEQKESTFDKICLALRDNNLNNQCAEEDREILFNNSDCPGTF